MSYRDDDYQDDDNLEDEEEILDDDEQNDDDDESVRRPSSSSNPFTTGGYSSRTSGDSGRTNVSGDRYGGSSSRLPGSPSSGSYGSSGSSPGNNTPSSPGAPRPSYSSGGTTPSSPNAPRPFNSGGSSGNNTPSSPGAPRPSYSSGGTTPSSPNAPRPTYGGGSPAGNTPPSPNAPRPPYSSGSSSPSTTGGSASDKPADKAKDGDRKSPLDSISGVTKGLGGLTSRFGGGDKKENKPAAPKSDGSGGNPLSKGLGGLTSRFSGGDKKDDKPAAPKSDGSGGNPLSKGLGGLTSRLGGGDKKDNKPAASSSAGSFANKSPLGNRPGGAPMGSSTPATPKASAAPRVSLSERLKASLPFGRTDTKKPSTVREKVAKASKAPKVDSAGLSLDSKLDILGVALLLGSLALFFSSMSATKGQLTEAVNTFLSQLLGWGAIAVPLTMFAIGMWLVIRHFGDEAPVINSVRIAGVVILYLGLLVVFQYIDSVRSYYEIAVLDDFLQASIQSGRGGGWVGAQMYTALISYIGEMGGIFIVAGTVMIGTMLLLRISAAELAIFLISIGRSFVDARHRRVQDRQAAARLAAQAAAAAAPPQISVSKPAAAELPAANSPALPAAIPASEALPMMPEPRPIPITMGGKTVTAFFDAGESVPVEAKASNPSLPSGSAPVPQDGDAAKPSLASKLFSAVPGRGSKPETSEPAKAEGEKSGSLLGGRLFNRSTPENKPPVTSTPLVTPAASAEATAASESGQKSIPDASPFRPAPASVSQKAEEPAPISLGDLMKPSAPAAGNRPAMPAPALTPSMRDSVRPFSAEPPKSLNDEEDDEDEQLANLPPARPKGTGPLPRPDNPFMKPQSLTERNDRLNAIRTGQLTPASGKPEDEKLPDSSSNTPAVPAASRPPFTPDAPRPFGTSDKPAASPAAFTAGPPRQAAYPSDEINRSRSPINGANGQEAPKPEQATPITSLNPEQPGPSASSAFRRPDTPPVAPSAPTTVSSKARKVWKLPDYRNLLSSGSETDFDRETLLERARTIEETLQSFGAPGRVVEVNTGPVITQFGVEPDYLVMRSGKKNRVKVGAIAQLDKDLQLALGAKSIRIEAPVPGKGYVGIEVPNEEASMVSLRDVMDAEEFKRIANKSPLAIALGQSVDGAPIAADLASMPHLLIAGTTGSGKSVCVNSIICCLIANNTPDKVKFIMVDPKRVELTGYNGIPHLIAPVVVELERIVGVLKWVTREMDERYKKFSNAGARNIEDYNKHLSPEAEQMPYIVVIIDELADLMMLAPDETERVITRIAALARATGIHLVIATQRPSVDVVTGLIKANFPARIAFAVASGVDSRVILDQPGAERLLGRGDMLYLSGDAPSALRLQGVYLSDTEITNITRYWKMFTAGDEPARPISALVLDESIKEEPRNVMPSSGSSSSSTQHAFWDDNKSGDNADDDAGPSDGQDELYEQAVEIVRRLNRASVSLLQRRLRIGYTRSARLIDMMEEQGIVGPAQEGSKPREVLSSPIKD